MAPGSGWTFRRAISLDSYDWSASPHYAVPPAVAHLDEVADRLGGPPSEPPVCDRGVVRHGSYVLLLLELGVSDDLVSR